MFVTNTNVFAVIAIVSVTNTNVFAANTFVLVMNANVLVTNTFAFVMNAFVFVANTNVFISNKFVFVMNTFVSVANTIVFVVFTAMVFAIETSVMTCLSEHSFANPKLVSFLKIQPAHVITESGISLSDLNPFSGSHSGNSVLLLYSIFHIEPY